MVGKLDFVGIAETLGLDNGVSDSAKVSMLDPFQADGFTLSDENSFDVGS